MIDYKYQEGIIIVGSERSILNVTRKCDGTERLKGVFDLDNRRYYSFTEEELGRDVFVAIDNTADRYADAWVDPSCPWYERRFPSNYVLHDYAKHHDLKLRIKFMNARRSKQYSDIITATLSSSRYDRYTKIVTRLYDVGVEHRVNWYWDESCYAWLPVDHDTLNLSVSLPRCNGKNARALIIDEWFNDNNVALPKTACDMYKAVLYREAMGLTSDTKLTTRIDYTRFSKAIETMPDILKRPYNKNDNMAEVVDYCKDDVLATEATFYSKEAFKMEYKYHRIPQIKNVIIAEPYTTILWSDNTKTQVKCTEGDRFDPEHGFTMAVLKKIYEEPKKPNAYSKWVKGWVKKGLAAGEKQKKNKQKKEKEECGEYCDLSSFVDGN